VRRKISYIARSTASKISVVIGQSNRVSNIRIRVLYSIGFQRIEEAAALNRSLYTVKYDYMIFN